MAVVLEMGSPFLAHTPKVFNAQMGTPQARRPPDAATFQGDEAEPRHVSDKSI